MPPMSCSSFSAKTPGLKRSTMSRRACAPSSAASCGWSLTQRMASRSARSSGSAIRWPAKAPSGMGRRCVKGSGIPLRSLRKAVGPDQLVASTGRAMAMASAWGRPQPSPRLGSTRASAERYAPGSSPWESRRRSLTRGSEACGMRRMLARMAAARLAVASSACGRSAGSRPAPAPSAGNSMQKSLGRGRASSTAEECWPSPPPCMSRTASAVESSVAQSKLARMNRCISPEKSEEEWYADVST
mmetsp:Transcript_22005/g.83726  ORF Transcript_22005/g.83726 Transcript_22005/m.83726 type:complete len:244 (+) Transcript_22005:1384-2115(+)